MKKLISFMLMVFVSLAVFACQEETTTAPATTATTAQTSPTSTNVTTQASTTTEPMTSAVTTTEVPTTVPATTTGPITSTAATTTSQTSEDEMYMVRSIRPYLFVNVGEPLDLTEIGYKSLDGTVTLSQTVLSNPSSGLALTQTSLTANTEGIHTFAFTYDQESLEIYVFAKDIEATDYLIYEMSFDDLPNGMIPDDYSIERLGGSAGIHEGFLYVDSPATAEPTRVLLPQYLRGFKNYILEVDFTILSAVEPTRWASVMYRFATDNYFQMAIRQNATANNGVEFAKAINGQWNVPAITSYSEMINPDKIYHLKIDLFGATVNEYIDDTLLITYDKATDYSNGYIGVQSSGSRAIFNNFEIRIPETYLDHTTTEYGNIPTVYTHESNIIMAPTVVQMIDNPADLNLLAEEARPATAIFRINQNMDVATVSGVTIMPILDALDVCKDQIIPAFYTRYAATGVAVAQLMSSYGVRDALIISPNVPVIQQAREQHAMMRGVLEIAYNPAKPQLTDADLLNIRNQTNIAGAVAALLPSQYATVYNVEYLQRLLVSVWINVVGGTDVQILQGIVSGANGLVTRTPVSVYDSIDTFPENSMVRQPLIIGHRGMPSRGPENTVEGSVQAMEAGAHVIELDVFLSKKSSEGSVNVDILQIGDTAASIMLGYRALLDDYEVIPGNQYKVEFDVNATAPGSFTFELTTTDNIANVSFPITLVAGDNQVSVEFTAYEARLMLTALLGEYGQANLAFDNFQLYNLEQVDPETAYALVTGGITNGDFTDSSIPLDDAGSSWITSTTPAEAEITLIEEGTRTIIVMHDSTTTRTTGVNLTVEEATLEQLRALTIIDNFGAYPGIPVPTLEDYFIRFKDEPVVIFIEIKSSSPLIVEHLRDLLDKHDFYDQAVVITFQPQQIMRMNLYLPELSNGLLGDQMINANNLSSSILASLNQVVPISSTVNPYYGPVSAEYLLEMQHRGITVWPWTINSITDFYKYYLLGVGGITTDLAYLMQEEFVEFWLDETEFSYSISSPTTIEIMGVCGTPGGFEYQYPISFEIVSGSETGITFGTKNRITGALSTGDVYLLPSFTTTLSNGKQLILYYDLVHIKIVE